MRISLSAGCRTQRTTLNAPVRFAWLESETHFALKAKKPGSSRPNPTKRSLKRKSCGLGGELSIAGFRIVRFLPPNRRSTGSSSGTTLLPIPNNVFGTGFGKITNRDPLIGDAAREESGRPRLMMS